MKLLVVPILIFLHLFTNAQATEHILEEQYIDSTSWVLGASVGYGNLSNPLVERDDLPLYVLPDIRYYGERFSFDNLNVSYALLEKPGMVIELIGTQNEDGVYFPGDARRGYAALTGAHPGAPLDLFPADAETKPVTPTHRSMSYLAGMEFRHYSWLNLYASWQTDMSKVHHGNEARIRAIKYAQLKNLQLVFEATAIHKSKRLVDYYYHVGMNEVTNSRLFYQASSTTNYLLKANIAYPVSESFAIVASVQHKWLGSEISDSPTVKDSSLFSFFLGVKYVL